MSLGLLWSDKCFFLVLIVIVVLILNGLRSPPTRLAFMRIFSKPVSVASAIVLLFFLIIGVLDSIHFKPNSRSLLDNILSPIGDVYEKTYSSPLALTLYASEVLMVDGRVKLTHPRLNYVKPTLKNNAQKWMFIRQVLLDALWVSGLLVLGLGLLTIIFKICTRKFLIMSSSCKLGEISKDGTMPITEQLFAYAEMIKRCISKTLLTGLLTLFICLLLVIASYWLSRGLHLLGTGKIGQDIFYATVKSIRTGLMIGILTTLFMMPLALLLGIAAGYFGGIIDDVIQYIYTTLSSIPGVLLITASVLSMQTYIANHPEQFTTLEENADARLLALCFILGVTSWTSLCRLLRAEAMKLKEVDYVLAAKALGSGPFKIIFKHLLPNVMHIVVITFVLDFSFLVLAEAVLSYVGVGVSPLTISWGNMINAARLELAREPLVWWPMLAAFGFMFTFVLASNLLADAVEDAFNPRHHSSA